MRDTWFLILGLITSLLKVCSASDIPYNPSLVNKTRFCEYGVHLEWIARVGGSIIATPRIVDLMHDGQKEILIPTFSNFFEALSGLNGRDVPGFPFVHEKFKTYATPLPVDMDGDGRTEWLVAMYTGELIVFTQEGKAMATVQIPPLVVKKDWMKLRNATLDKAMGQRVPRLLKKGRRTFEEIRKNRHVDDLTIFRTIHADQRESPPTSQVETSEPQNCRGTEQHSVASVKLDKNDTHHGKNKLPFETDIINDKGHVRDTNSFAYEEENPDPTQIGPNGGLSREAKASMNLLFHPELYQTKNLYSEEEDAFSRDYILGKFTTPVAEDEVAVDAHILSTPVITDVDKNGDLDVILHVSYFFDTTEYEGEARNLLPKDINPDDYIATAVLCINLVTGELKWIYPIELTLKNSTAPAYALSSALVINTDGDAGLEIFLTSSTGRVIKLSAQGEPLPGDWPNVRLGPMTASPVAEDIQATGELSICTGDNEGKIACFTPNGSVVWEQNVTGGLADRVTFGDVNGDGFVDVVFGTTAGFIYALDGRDGHILEHFPIITRGPIISPVLLLNVLKADRRGGLHVIAPSHDGNLYIVDAISGCIESFDIDEKSSTMVLADDLTGNGRMDLVVSTIGGGVYVFETASPFNPAKVWASETKGTNGYTASENYVAISIDPDYRIAKDIRGDNFKLKFTIQDNRKVVKNRVYKVSVHAGPRVRLYQGIFYRPLSYKIDVHTPLERMYSDLSVMLSLPNGQVFTDTISVSFNMHFLETIKYVLVIPFIVTAAALMVVRKQHTAQREEEAEILL